MIRLIAPYAIGAALFAALVGGAFYAGMNYANDRAALDAANDYREGRKDADDATADLPVDDSGNLEWLRDYLGR